ncbi:hypothetical protein PsYK624_103290 [Phanerochaete sordida]|uniref:Uncharacterized protein n=1 Tax=Phanerochaete sordida TaxID=48140 RepID=A0A9P3GFU9_9APHY|nr:hypothetical protein PsYK624_103290 [Phanerochaete sordida]
MSPPRRWPRGEFTDHPGLSRRDPEAYGGRGLWGKPLVRCAKCAERASREAGPPNDSSLEGDVEYGSHVQRRFCDWFPYRPATGLYHLTICPSGQPADVQQRASRELAKLNEHRIRRKVAKSGPASETQAQTQPATAQFQNCDVASAFGTCLPWALPLPTPAAPSPEAPHTTQAPYAFGEPSANDTMAYIPLLRTLMDSMCRDDSQAQQAVRGAAYDHDLPLSPLLPQPSSVTGHGTPSMGAANIIYGTGTSDLVPPVEQASMQYSTLALPLPPPTGPIASAGGVCRFCGQ